MFPAYDLLRRSLEQIIQVTGHGPYHRKIFGREKQKEEMRGGCRCSCR